MRAFTEELCYYGQTLLNAYHASAAPQPSSASDLQQQQQQHSHDSSSGCASSSGDANQGIPPAEPQSQASDWSGMHQGIADLLIGVAGSQGPSIAALVAVQRLHLLALQLAQRYKLCLEPATVGRLLAVDSSFERLR